MSKLNATAQLIVNKEFDMARQLLERVSDDPKALYLLSLLYRYDKFYQQELEIIKHATAINSNNNYWQERLEWHNLPLFDRLVPRQALRFSYDPVKIPTQDILEQTCIVTSGGSDLPYYQLFVQLIESIRNTSYYKNVQICVLDAGLTEEHKHELMTSFENVTIKDPGWDFDIPFMNDWRRGSTEIRNGMKGCTARPFMDKHFPGYRYYMWLDTDTWVQHEGALHDYLYAAQIYGLGLARDHVHDTWANNFWIRKNKFFNIYPSSYDDFLNPRYYYTAGSFCIDITTGVFDLWRKCVLETVPTHGFCWGNEEINFVYAINQYCKSSPVPPLDRVNHFSWFREGLPVLGELPDILYMPSSLKPLGVIHLIGSFLTKEYPFFPMMKTNAPLNQEQIQRNINIYTQIEQTCKSNKCTPANIKIEDGNTKDTSYHYRTWPWADKPEVLDLLMQEAQKVLQ